MTTETVKLPANWPVPDPFVVTMPVTTTSFVAKASETGHVNGWAVDGDDSASTVTVNGYHGASTGHADGWAVEGDGAASTVTVDGYQGGSPASPVTIKGHQGVESTMTVTATYSGVTLATTVTVEPVVSTEAASQTIPASGGSANAWSPAGSDSNSDTGSTSPSASGPWIATYTGAAGAAAVSATMIVSSVSLCFIFMQLSGL